MQTPDDFDSPWKDVLEIYFQEFMAFFFPDAHRDIDWSKGYENRDKELQQIVRDAELGKRLADKLMCVWRLDGAEQMILIHIEVQGDYDRDFAERMYIYNYRVYDRYRRPVVSLAILGDENTGWRPDHFIHDFWGCRTGIRFPVIKLIDYEARWDELEADINPFAIMVMAHLKTKATRNDSEDRLQWKLALIKRLYVRGYQRKDVLELFRFIDWLLLLPEELAQRFDEQLHEYEAAMSRPYITSIERTGIQKGIEQGIQQGIEQGIEQGLMLQARSSLLTTLETRFGEIPDDVRHRIESLQDLSKLQNLLKPALTLESLDAFHQVLRSLADESDARHS